MKTQTWDYTHSKKYFRQYDITDKATGAVIVSGVYYEETARKLCEAHNGEPVAAKHLKPEGIKRKTDKSAA